MQEMTSSYYGGRFRNDFNLLNVEQMPSDP